jgi:tetratricopeptide (TPR) repeat protein
MMHPALAIALYASERYEEALQQANRAIDIEPMLFTSYWIAGLASAALGAHEQAIAALERGRPFAQGDPVIEGFLGWAYALAGNRDAAQTIAGMLEARRAKGYVSGASIGQIYQGLGDMDRAIEWFSRACEDRAGDCATFARLPHFSAARRDARFQALSARIESGDKAHS